MYYIFLHLSFLIIIFFKVKSDFILQLFSVISFASYFMYENMNQNFTHFGYTDLFNFILYFMTYFLLRNIKDDILKNAGNQI